MERREFVKAAGITGAAASAGIFTGVYAKTFIGDLAPGGRSISRTTGTNRTPVPSVCLMCDAKCGIIGFLEESVLVKIEGNPRDPNSRGKICAAGIATIQNSYNPERILKPMKRNGNRSEGKMVEISWNEALKTISDKIKEIMKNNSTKELIFVHNSDSIKYLTNSFLSAIGSPTVVNTQDLYNLNESYLLNYLFGTSALIPDIADSKYILNFGSNPFESHRHFVPLISRLIEAHVNGAKLITFDPRINNTSGKSDEWYPIMPNSDLIIAMSLLNIIMNRGLFDRDSIAKWLNVSPRDFAQITSKYTPEIAEYISGVKESHIRRLAIEFATTKNAVAIYGGGVHQQNEGVASLLAVMLLNIVTGNIDSPGGFCMTRTFDYEDSEVIKNSVLPHELFQKINRKE